MPPWPRPRNERTDESRQHAKVREDSESNRS